jgi:hypothetical protein
MPAWPKAIEGSRRLVEGALKGRESLSKISPATRERAAQFYEEMANHTVNTLANPARLFNLERARYLREGGSVPPGTLPEFIKRTTLPSIPPG